MTFRGLANRVRMIARGEWRRVYYDLKCKAFGLDLGIESIEALGLDSERSNWCSNSGGPELDVVLRTLPIRPGDCALDIGCGKGGAIITMAEYPFWRVDGVEISEKVASVAERNLARMQLEDRCRIHRVDAAEFQDLHRYQFIYMYNPFPRVVMEAVLRNVARSLAEWPRPLTLVYKNPVHHDLVGATGFRLMRQFAHPETPFHVYSAALAAPAPVEVWRG